MATQSFNPLVIIPATGPLIGQNYTYSFDNKDKQFYLTVWITARSLYEGSKARWGGLNSLCLLKYQDGIQMSPSCTIVKETYTGNVDGEKTKRTKREASCAFIQALSAVKQCTCNLHIFFSTTRASELAETACSATHE
jgi:hypothetical protein